MAVPPNLVPFITSTGLPEPASYGVDSQQQLDADIFRDHLKLQNPVTFARELRAYMVQGWQDMSATLVDIAADADLLLAGTTYQEVAGNVAEYFDIPLAALHYFPFRPNRQVVPVPLPLPVIRRGFALGEWAHWRVLKQAEDIQRQALGLAPAKVRAIRRMLDRGALEIQAYDEVLFPGLSAEWGPTRPLVGSMSMELATDTDADVMSWIANGKPPIYFGFGSMPVESPADAVAMIENVTAELGERALISSGVWDLPASRLGDHVKLVGPVNHAAVFPLCRALVHHGGAGTTAAGLRAGVPTVVLWVSADQPVWAGQIKKLKLGASQRFSKTTPASLKAALRTALQPDCAAWVQATAQRLTRPADSVARTADLLEQAVRQ
ncbi:hypothetical protein MPHO_08960 [Mycolicibacterium phocaicum]|nr:hypothetical protein MPHO_08960 [Mycolicibacterium phocaicum]